MGCDGIGTILIWVILVLVETSPFARGLRSFNPDSLNSFLHDLAYKSIEKKPRTGALHRVPLPSNFSGMEASIIRLRRSNLWARGVDFGPIKIPPRVTPLPYVRKVAVVVYQNLGNWSSHYYKVPGHVLISPVVGFTIYNASRSSPKLNLRFMGGPISIRFPRLRLARKNATRKCAKFGANGSVKLSEMTRQNLCLVKGVGQFGVVIRAPAPAVKKGKKKWEKDWKWWVVCVGGGVGGAALVGMAGVVITKLVRGKKLQEMEKESEQGVALDTFWIGTNRVPCATVVRTQPTLEE